MYRSSSSRSSIGNSSDTINSISHIVVETVEVIAAAVLVLGTISVATVVLFYFLY